MSEEEEFLLKFNDFKDRLIQDSYTNIGNLQQFNGNLNDMLNFTKTAIANLNFKIKRLALEN